MSRVATVLSVVVLVGCFSPPPSQERIETLLRSGVELATEKLDAGLAAEATVLLRAVERVDASFEGVSPLRRRLVDQETYTVGGRLGINRRMRTKRDTNFLVPLLLWAPNRVFDLLDLVTFNVHIGPGAYANVHATRAIQAGAGVRGVFGIGAHDQRIVGIHTESEAGFVAVALGAETVSGSAVGFPGGVTTGADAMAGMHFPSGEIYQSFRDYWAVGVSLTAGLAGGGVDLHLAQLLDFGLGILFIDIARDDYGTTRGLQLDRLDVELIRSLHEVERARLWELREEPDVPPDSQGSRK